MSSYHCSKSPFMGQVLGGYPSCKAYLPSKPWLHETYHMKSYTTAVLVSCAVAPAAAVISYRYKQIRLLSIAGFVSFLIFAVTIATSTVSNYAAFWGYQVFLGCGLTLTVFALVSAAQLSAPPELMYASTCRKQFRCWLTLTIAPSPVGYSPRFALWVWQSPSPLVSLPCTQRHCVSL